MNTKNLIEGLELLAIYRKDSEGYNVGAEHDVVYAYATELPLLTKDVERMIELGWHQEVNYSGDEFSVSDYDQDESWVAYV